MNAKDDPHFGLMLAATVNGLAVGSYREMVVVSQTAEEYGFDSVWLCDHFLTISPGEYAKVAGIAADTGSATGTETGGAGQCAPSRSLPLLECWTALAALSRDTTKLRLGTSVLCNSYRHPSVLAKMAATLDVISQGRLDLGLGAGWFRRESQATASRSRRLATESPRLPSRCRSSRPCGPSQTPPTPAGFTPWTAPPAIRRRCNGHILRCGSAGKATGSSASPLSMPRA